MTTYYEMNEDFLAHYGVLGMKWGRRKAKPSSGGNLRQKKVKTSEKRKGLSKNQKTALKVGAAVVGTALAVYGGYKLSKFINNKSGQIQIQKGKAAFNKVMESYKDVSVNNSKGKKTLVATSKRSRYVWDNANSNLTEVARSITEHNKKVSQKAINAEKEVLSKKMNFGQKTANVASYYINKRRKK